MKMTVTKIDVATSQLKEAINLFFEERDPVSIHTLVGAALQILNDHITDKSVILNNNLFLHKDSLYIKDEYRKEWVDAINKAKNFFKHADRDIVKGVRSLEFETEVNDFNIFGALQSLKILNSEIYENTLEFRFFNYWFLFNKPNLLSEEGKKYIFSMLKTNPDIFSNLSGMQSKKYNYDMLTYAKLHNIKDVQQLKERFPLKSNV